MSGITPLEVPQVVGWNVDAARSTIEIMRSTAEQIEQDAKTAGDRISGSQEYFDGDAGEASRSRGRQDREATTKTADVLEVMARLASTLIEEIERDIEIIRDRVADVEESRWDLYVEADGTVRSRKSNWETMQDYFPLGGPAVLSKELSMRTLSSAIKNALWRIQENDQIGAENFVRTLEELDDSVKTGVARTPEDPELAKILEEYQTDSSEGEPRLWPTGFILEMIQKVKPDFNPMLLTSEEISALEKLVFENQDPVGVLENVAFAQEADETANAMFPASTADGQGDAFRHAYWNALMTQRFGEEWTSEYATAHEKTGGNTPQREAMDLYNNQRGREIALANPDASPQELQELIKKEISEGGLLVIQNETPDGVKIPEQIRWSNEVDESLTGPPPGVGIPIPGN